jgi:KDO2-lipid IV(A) lauroyltransferase
VERAELPIWRRARRQFYYGLARAVLSVSELVPPTVGRAFGVSLARLALRLRPVERARAAANLALAFPQLEAGARARLLRESVDAFGRNIYDTLALTRHLANDFAAVDDDPDAAGESAVDVVRRLQAGGRGVLILTGHLGCWELLGAFLARRLPRFAVVTGTIHNPSVDELVQRRRRDSGLVVLPRDGGPRPVVRHLRTGGTLAILLDQNTRVASRPVPFFGRPAPTPTGFAKLALRYRIPALPVVMARRGHRHVIRHGTPLWPGSTAARNDAIDTYLRRCNAELETAIRRNPTEWIWFHQRWEDHCWNGAAAAAAT